MMFGTKLVIPGDLQKVCFVVAISFDVMFSEMG